MQRVDAWTVHEHDFVPFDSVLRFLVLSLLVHLLLFLFFCCFATLLMKLVISILVIRRRGFLPNLRMLGQKLLKPARPLVLFLFDYLRGVVAVVINLLFQGVQISFDLL